MTREAERSRLVVSMSYLDIAGWSSDIVGPKGFYSLVAQRIPKGGMFVEVGAFLGRSLAYMGEIRPDLDLWAVDPWGTGSFVGETLLDGHDEDLHIIDERGLFGAFLHLMQTYAPGVLARTHIVRAEYTKITHPPADCIFVDACHTFENGMADLAHAARNLKPGGLLCGHDYAYTEDGKLSTRFDPNPLYPGLARAIDQFAKENGKIVRVPPSGEAGWTSCWLLEDR
jgi:hypothetical protein